MTLSSTDIKNFHLQGFIGPFESFSSNDQIDKIFYFIKEMLELKKSHPIYGRFSVRDWHLINSDILKLFNNDNVVDKVKGLLGNDLILWRSKIFHKRPGEGALGWHQEWGAFNGEEIGNDKPSLMPISGNCQSGDFWDLTIWFALQDIDISMGPIQFARATHTKRYPIKMVPIVGSAFWHDPCLGIDNVSQLLDMAKNNSLVLDIDTSDIFENVDTSNLTILDVKEIIHTKLSNKVAAITLDFNDSEQDIVTLPMKKGQFVIFSERTMHGSSPNYSQKDRIAINCRITKSDVLVYPNRLIGDFIDGSNLDVTNHKCVLVSGINLNNKNIFE